MDYAINKKATFDYEILEKFQAGIVLSGQEVKSVKAGNANLKGAFVTFKGGEAYLTNCHIAPYKMAGKLIGYDPDMSRKLLLSKSELKFLLGKLEQKGLTLVAFRLYNVRNLIKLEFFLGKGKKKADKREDIKERDTKREIGRAIKGAF